MSAPVNVLAVWDAAIEATGNMLGHDDPRVIEMRAARAAVAILIEKADTAERALWHLILARQVPAVSAHYDHDLRVALTRCGVPR